MPNNQIAISESKDDLLTPHESASNVGFEEAQESSVRCWDETNAELLRYNTGLQSWLGGIGTAFTLKQFFRMWPNILNKYESLFDIIGLCAGSVGYILADSSLSYPSAGKYRFLKGAFRAYVESCMIFSFMIAELNDIYCSHRSHWGSDNHCNIEDDEYFKKYFPVAFFFAFQHFLFNMIPSIEKERLAAQGNAIKKGIVYFEEILSKFLVSSRSIQSVFLVAGEFYSKAQPLANVRKGNTLYFEIASVAGGIATVGAIAIVPRHRHLWFSFFMYTSAIVLGAYTVKRLYDTWQNCNEKKDDYSCQNRSIGATTLAFNAALAIVGSAATYAKRKIFRIEQNVIARALRTSRQYLSSETVSIFMQSIRDRVNKNIIDQVVSVTKARTEAALREQLNKELHDRTEVIREQARQDAEELFGVREVDVSDDRLGHQPSPILYSSPGLRSRPHSGQNSPRRASTIYIGEGPGLQTPPDDGVVTHPMTPAVQKQPGFLERVKNSLRGFRAVPTS